MVRNLFKPYGNIKSISLNEKFSKFGFVWYGNEENTDNGYGRKCAEIAIQELNDRYMGNGLRLVV